MLRLYPVLYKILQLFSSVPDGEYYLKFYSEDELTSKTLHIFSGISATFTVRDEKYVNPLDSSTPKETENQKHLKLQNQLLALTQVRLVGQVLLTIKLVLK